MLYKNPFGKGDVILEMKEEEPDITELLKAISGASTNITCLTATSWKDVIEDLPPGVYACGCQFYEDNLLRLSFENINNPAFNDYVPERSEEFTESVTIQPGPTTVIKDSLDYF